MRVQVHSSGGIAYLPGRAQPYTLESRTLSPQQADELERLIAASNFFALSATPQGEPRGADYRRYTITVDDGLRQHSVQVYDPISDPKLQQLLAFVQHHQRAQA